MKYLVILTAFCILSAYQSARSCCAFIESWADTLADGSIVIYRTGWSTPSVGTEPLWEPVDTLSPGNLLEELVTAYQKSDYALIGEVSEIRTFRHPINDSLDGEMDSVYFLIHSTLKGNVSEGFWSLDDYNHSGRVYRTGEDLVSYIVMMSINPSPYTNIENKLALMLTSSLDTIRRTGLEPAGYCTYSHQGYYIGTDFTIEKHYSFGNLQITIQVDMADFLEAIAVSAHPHSRWSRSDLTISVVRQGRFITISVPAALKPVRFDIMDGKGRAAGLLTTGSDGCARWDISGLSPGMYYIRALGLSGAVFRRLRL